MASQHNIILACSKCGARNYVIKSNQRRTDRLEVKKYCKHCNAHTFHKQTK